MEVDIKSAICGVGGLALIAYASNIWVSLGAFGIILSHWMDCHRE